MDWFGSHLDKRTAPETLMPGAKSVLVLAVIYRDEKYDQFLKKGASAKIARYSAGKDYHKLLRKKGKRLLERIKEEIPQCEGRVTVDTAPVPEKVLAVQAGLGFRGKNTNVIHPRMGSYFLISLLFLDFELEADGPLNMSCVGCRLCVAKCPTGALDGERIDARRCISYLTLEKKSMMTSEEIESSSPWLSGCDVCQEVCPHNIHAAMAGHYTKENKFIPEEDIYSYLRNPKPLTEEEWDLLSRGRAFRRTGLQRWNMLADHMAGGMVDSKGKSV
jgi:epoxyqueuosine reductase